jgi:hypothetical protein
MDFRGRDVRPSGLTYYMLHGVVTLLAGACRRHVSVRAQPTRT